MKEPEVGDFAECIDGHAGFVIDIKDSPYGRMIFIALADGRVYHFTLDMLCKDEDFADLSAIRGKDERGTL